MNIPQLPFMSVIICTYNGAGVVGRAIEGLLAQDYPRDRFEIIVVNDGSTDNTADVVRQYPVRLVEHATNLGIPAGRNTGLAHMKGEYYVCFDDDGVVAPTWLRTLAESYQLHPDALGMGSIVREPERLHGLVDHFMAAAGSGNPPSLALGASRHPLKRFFAYITDQLRPFQPASDQPYPVRQLNGASASFPRTVLESVHGWDADLRWIEDTDICTRITTTHPGRHFYAAPQAILIHDPKMSLRTFIRRPYVRGTANLAYYRRQGLTPPVFPFPLAWIGLTTLALLGHPILGLITALIAPQLLYCWWPIRAAQERRPLYLIFSYLQMIEELSTIAGLVRGHFILMRRSRHA